MGKTFGVKHKFYCGKTLEAACPGQAERGNGDVKGRQETSGASDSEPNACSSLDRFRIFGCGRGFLCRFPGRQPLKETDKWGQLTSNKLFDLLVLSSRNVNLVTGGNGRPVAIELKMLSNSNLGMARCSSVHLRSLASRDRTKEAALKASLVHTVRPSSCDHAVKPALRIFIFVYSIQVLCESWLAWVPGSVPRSDLGWERKFPAVTADDREVGDTLEDA